MASLTTLKGYKQGATFPLDRDEILLGREADCQVVIDVPSVSRKHAVIRRREGKYFIEDSKSRAGTLVNGEAVRAPVRLHHNDKIKICDTVFVFHDVPEGKPPLPAELKRGGDEEAEEEAGTSRVEATLHPSSREILETQPAEKLAFLLEVTAELTQTLDVEQILPRVVHSLFQVFRQADRAFIIPADGDPDRLVPLVVRTRRGEEAEAHFSKKVVGRCLEEGQAFLSEDASSDPRLSGQSVEDYQIRSVMVAPLKGRGGDKPFGVLQLDTQSRARKFTGEDLKLLMAVAGQTAIALVSARMHQILVARAELQRDLRLARQVQLSFLPKALPQVQGYEFFAHYAAALEVGGDYYDFVPLPDQRLAITIGDVAGKGVSAALLMAKVSADTRFTLLTEPTLAAAVGKLNGRMQEAGLLDRFVTLEAALLDPSRHEVTFINAGHLPAVVYRQADNTLGEAFSHQAGGFPLGIVDHFDYRDCAVLRLEPGDAVVLFSDGVTEARDKQDRDFGLPGVLAALRAGPMTPSAMGQQLVGAVQHHSRGCKQHDDITIVCFGRGVTT